jgi:hypothetical protein
MFFQAITVRWSLLCTGLVACEIPWSHAQEVSPSTFTSAEVCGECHEAIHAVWQESMHSRAFRNGVFQAAYRAAREEYSDERSRLCLNCHAPTTRKTRDYEARNPITSQGVTCDFCHSIRKVEFDGAAKHVELDVGRTKYGPLKHAQSPAHNVVDSELHRRSELCATCHEFRNEHGVPILETYSEWKAGPYAKEGKQCQDCHMPLVSGRVVVPGLVDTQRDGVNLHNISGSHDIERVRKAVTMKILGAAWVGEDTVAVRVSVANVGSGHRFPTGLPLHRAVLEVRLRDRGRLVAWRTVEFEKVLANRWRTPIKQEAGMFLDARSILSDTRLKPKEDRTVSVTFENVAAREAEIDARLSYEYSTHTIKVTDGVESIAPVEMKILLASDKRRLPR